MRILAKTKGKIQNVSICAVLFTNTCVSVYIMFALVGMHYK